MKTGKKKTTPATDRPTVSIESFSVSGVRAVGSTVFFNLSFGGMSFYGLRVVEGRNGDFIAFPERKGTDAKYYKHFYIPFSERTSQRIIDAVEEQVGDDE